MSRSDQIELRKGVSGWQYSRRSGESVLPMDWKPSKAEALRCASATARQLGIPLLCEVEL